MIRKIITIDSERCNGCGLCAAACHEGAIGMVNGKAVLLREDYCDGLGDCLPACPTGAITMTEREAPAYDEAAVAAHLAARKPAGGCAGGGGQPIHDGQELAEERGSSLYFLDRDTEIRFSHDNPDIQNLYEEFFEKPLSHRAHQLLHTEHQV